MINTLKTIIEFMGGADVVWLFFTVLAGTQAVKILLKALDVFTPARLRPFPLLIGSFAGWTYIGLSARGAMVGLSCGFIASATWFAVAARLEHGSWSEAGKYIAKRMMEVK